MCQGANRDIQIRPCFSGFFGLFCFFLYLQPNKPDKPNEPFLSATLLSPLYVITKYQKHKEGSLTYDEFKFAPACPEERYVFGSKRSGYSYGHGYAPLPAVEEWLSFMKKKGVKRVCSLLRERELQNYYEDDLLGIYQKEFGDSNVLTVPVEDYHLADVAALRDEILPFLAESEEKKLPVLVHCSGGSGRTGHVLAAWVVYRYGLPTEEALGAVGRNPREAVQCGLLGSNLYC